MHGHTDTVSILLRAGISRDARTKVDRTPLHVASQAGHFEIVQLLLKNNAIIDACDMVGVDFTQNDTGTNDSGGQYHWPEHTLPIIFVWVRIQ